jgi:hypothetical protein
MQFYPTLPVDLDIDFTKNYELGKDYLRHTKALNQKVVYIWRSEEVCRTISKLAGLIYRNLRLVETGIFPSQSPGALFSPGNQLVQVVS